jgi:hypothetical protein
MSNVMKRNETSEAAGAANTDDPPRTALAGEPPTAQSQDSCTTTRHSAQFIPVTDSRNRRVPGLWQRGSRFYGALWVDRGDGRKTARRFPLTLEDGRTPVRALAEAKEAHERLRVSIP